MISPGSELDLPPSPTTQTPEYRVMTCLFGGSTGPLELMLEAQARDGFKLITACAAGPGPTPAMVLFFCK